VVVRVCITSARRGQGQKCSQSVPSVEEEIDSPSRGDPVVATPVELAFRVREKPELTLVGHIPIS